MKVLVRKMMQDDDQDYAVFGNINTVHAIGTGQILWIGAGSYKPSKCKERIDLIVTIPKEHYAKKEGIRLVILSD